MATEAPTFFYRIGTIYRTQFDKILLTILKIYPILFLEHLFGIVLLERGIGIMSKNEIELFNMLYENDCAEQGVLTAIKVFSAFLERLAEDPMPPSAYPLESA